MDPEELENPEDLEHPDELDPAPLRSAAHRTDRVSVVLGNASLLGIGYMLMRRRRLAMVTLVASITLAALAVLYPHVPVWRLLLIAWWLGTVVHAWRLAHDHGRELPADRAGRRTVWRDRAIAGACLLLVGFGWFRLDTWAIVRDAEAAHTGGDCERAVGSLRWLSLGNQLAYSSASARGEDQRQACELLFEAQGEPSMRAAETLAEYIDHPGALWDGAGPMRAELLFDRAIADEGTSLHHVEDAFAQLSATLESAPGEAGRVREVVGSFLADLEAVESCKAQTIDEWLLAQEWEAAALAESVAPEAERLPERMFACVEATLMWDESAAAYQEFLERYPDHALADDAATAMLTKEMYCDYPAAYGGAEAYDGSSPMWMFGLDPEEYGFPDSWYTETLSETTLVVCVEGPERGSYQETCYYEPGADQLLSPFGPNQAEVDFYASRFTVKAYELRTGEVVEEYSEEIGDPCPDELEYEYYLIDSVPSEYDSDYSNADVRAMFERLVG
ncbi:hypothetical protein [Glycomyces tarimensis]